MPSNGTTWDWIVFGPSMHATKALGKRVYIRLYSIYKNTFVFIRHTEETQTHTHTHPVSLVDTWKRRLLEKPCERKSFRFFFVAFLVVVNIVSPVRAVCMYVRVIRVGYVWVLGTYRCMRVCALCCTLYSQLCVSQLVCMCFPQCLWTSLCVLSVYQCVLCCAAAALCMCYIAFNGYDIYLRVFMLSSMFHVFNGSFYRFACSFSLLLCGRLLFYYYIYT